MPIRFQVDPDFYDHPKTIGMSDAATALWVRAGSYSAAKLTDGYVADDALALLSEVPVKAARELGRRGLWSRVKGGWQFHEWAARNLTRARVVADREADRERKRVSRLESPESHTCHVCGHAYVTARADSKYCSGRCRKAASRARQNAKPQVDPHVVTDSVRAESKPDSARSPPGIHPVSVSVSVSESGSAGRVTAPAVTPSARPEPPRACPGHRDEPDPPPCRRCATAREAWHRWHADRRARLDAAPRCPTHPGELAANCRCCAADAKGAP